MRLLSIPRWLDETYGDDPQRPAVETVRAWCRDGRLYPRPRKHGRSYFLHPRATHVDPHDPMSIRDAKEYVHGSKAA